MIIRHGKLISQGWWFPYNAETPHVMNSLSKSFTSTAIGIAIDEGYLSLNDQVISFFPEETPINPDNNLKAMRIRDLLTMNTGHIKEPRVRNNEENWVKVFLHAKVELKPGTHFKYNSMATYMLSAILQKVTGEKLVDFLGPRLFEPLGIEKHDWDTCPKGINIGGWGLHIRTEAIAKLGQLYLQKGMWNGRQLLSEKWVEMATSKQVSNGSNPESDWEQGYGFQFWRCRYNCYRGDGAYGQFCIIMPDQDAVIAITSGTSHMQDILNLVWKYLLPEMQSSPLLPNPLIYEELVHKTSNLKLKPVIGEKYSPRQSINSGKKCRNACMRRGFQNKYNRNMLI
jgi:CubicO group peptidase (beta-lactamase class C family)